MTTEPNTIDQKRTSGVKWPQMLVNELSARRVLVIFGAGASNPCVSPAGNHPPGWESLLASANKRLRGDDPVISKLIVENKRYLDAAELLMRDLDESEFKLFLDGVFSQPKYEPSKIHRAIHRLDAKIVMTTNYDKIYEKTLNPDAGYVIRKYTDGEILGDVRSSNPLFIKIHGCIDSPGNIVFSRSQYFNARKRFSGFYSVLDALFTVHTILFIGYSLGDPDIQLVLENVSISSPCNYKHYALVPDLPPEEKVLRDASFEACNVRAIVYPKDADGGHSASVSAIEELADEVQTLRDVLS